MNGTPTHHIVKLPINQNIQMKKFYIRKKLTCIIILLSLQGIIHAQTDCINGMAGMYPCNGVNLLSHLAMSEMGGGSGNDIWGWTSSVSGKEYVIMGRTNGTAFVDISDPLNPIYVGNLPTHSGNSSWRDLKVHKDHAFIVSEAGGHGMQVFDLTQLDDVTTSPVTFSETAHFEDTGIGGLVGGTHNIVINEASEFAYLVGANLCGGGLIVVDISDPLLPNYVGCYSASGYTHDAQCVNYIGPDADYTGTEICFNSNGNNGVVIVDVTDKTDMMLISTSNYVGKRYTHQGWLTTDQQYFLMNDELDESQNGHNTRTHLWDVRDLDIPVYMGYFESTEAAIDHNLYIKGDYAYQSNYRAGLRILDVKDIANGNLEEIAYFDTYPSSNSANFSGTWSNYPYFESGVIAISNLGEGLFLVKKQDCVSLQLSAAMEGPYDDATGQMFTGLNVRGLLPGQTPISNIVSPTPAGQPYSAVPWNYSGTEGNDWTDSNYTADVVDWLMVSFRTSLAKTSEIGRTAAILHQDGSIDFPTRCPIPIAAADSVYVVIEHRNHMGIMSPTLLPIIGGTLTYDFMSSNSYRDATSFGQKQLPDGKWAMFAGDGDQNDLPSFDITGNDKAVWFDSNGQFDQYKVSDFDLNGDVNGGDKAYWFDNNGISSRVPK